MNLTWNKKRELVVKKTLFDTSKNLNMGSSCCFISISTKVGAKIFLTKEERDFAIKAQRTIPKITTIVAPKAGSKFSFWMRAIDINGQTLIGPFYNYKLWGYVTEKAKTITKVPLSVIDKISDELEKYTTFNPWDISYENLGYIGDYYCMIDFDKNTLLGTSVRIKKNE